MYQIQRKNPHRPDNAWATVADTDCETEEECTALVAQMVTGPYQYAVVQVPTPAPATPPE